MVTVNVLTQVAVAPQELVTVKVTVVEPPHFGGAVPADVVSVGLQPPEKLTLFFQLVNNVSTAPCVLQDATVVSDGQVRVRLLGAVTVKVAVQVLLASHVLVTVKVTVLVPPQAAGAPVLLLVKTALQPPDLVAVLSQVVNLESMADWVWQAASVWFVGQVSTTEVGVGTV